MRSEPLISTIIPAFNAAGTLRDAVRSVLSQGIEDLEVIIVNDGSFDATQGIAEELALADERVWVAEQPNRGVSAARNTGLAGARGEWVHFLDADDWLLPGAFANLLHAARCSRLDAAAAGSELFDEQALPLGWTLAIDSPGPLGVAELLERNRFQPSACVIRRTHLLDTRFDEGIDLAEDWDLWLRLSERGLRWAVVQTPAAAYRLRRAGASRQFARMADSMRALLERAVERCRTNHTGIVPPAALRHERCDAALRRCALHQATAAAMTDCSPGAEAAFTVLMTGWAGASGADRTDRITAEELADAAYWMIPFADGLAPSAWASADEAWTARAARALDGFWGRCIAEGCIPASHPERARERLAELMVPPAEVAEALGARCAASGTGRAVTLVGLGRNAAHLAPALRRRGLTFDARDDRPAAEAQASFASIAGLEIEVDPIDAPYNPASLYVLTPDDDRALLGRLPAGVESLRWSECRAALSARALDRLLLCWPSHAQSPSVLRRKITGPTGPFGAAA